MVRNSEHPTDEELWHYLDDNIQPPGLIDHISDCPWCQKRLEEQQSAFDAVTSAPHPELSAMLRARTIRTFVDYRRSKPSFMELCMVRIPLYQVAGIVAAAVLFMQIIGSKTDEVDTHNTTPPSFQKALQESLIGP